MTIPELAPTTTDPMPARQASETHPACLWCWHHPDEHAAATPLRPCTACACRFLVDHTTQQLVCATAGCGHPLGRHVPSGCGMPGNERPGYGTPGRGLPYCPCTAFQPDPAMIVGSLPPPHAAEAAPAGVVPADVAVGELVIDARRWQESLAGTDAARWRVTPMPAHHCYDLRLVSALKLSYGSYLVISAARDEGTDWIVLQRWIGGFTNRDGEVDPHWLPEGEPVCLPVGCLPALGTELERAAAVTATMTGWQASAERRQRLGHTEHYTDPPVVPAAELAEYLRSVDVARLTQAPPAELGPDVEPDWEEWDD